MKGIVLAGGSGTRLYPVTLGVSKQLLPVYDKPMIYYPISTLMLVGIRDILIITSPNDKAGFKRLLGDGSRLGLRIDYAVQITPMGIADAFIVGRSFVGKDRVALALGDNVFYGHGLPAIMRRASKRANGATIFAYQVKDPQRYGVVTFNSSGRATRLEEKPRNPKSNWSIPGIYFYDNRVLDIAARLKPSARGELEITDVNAAYLRLGELHVEKMGRGIAWLDTGTPESLLQASHFIQTIQERQGLKVACLEEMAVNLGYVRRRGEREDKKAYRW